MSSSFTQSAPPAEDNGSRGTQGTQRSKMVARAIARAGVDFDGLRKRNRFERDKRVRPAAESQYAPVAEVFPQLAEDPWRGDVPSREPVDLSTEVLIIGGGFAGLQAGARLREAGVVDITIVESGADFGGTWYWNRYPGAQCDIDSYVYIPLLEQIGHIPSRKYAGSEEIRECAEKIATKFDLYRGALFSTHVSAMTWSDADNRWLVTTNRGDRIHARFVVKSNPALDVPKLPRTPGIENFKGHMFHTSRWDYGYTGGSEADPTLDKLAGKRVLIVGTGATAIQVIPHLAKHADRLFVVQRTPSFVGPREQETTDPQWAASLQEGWQRERIASFDAVNDGLVDVPDLVDDGWTRLFKELADVVPEEVDPASLTEEELMQLAELADFRNQVAMRERMSSIVDDPDLAERLMPWYRRFCKRPCFHDDYLPALTRENVELVDTDGEGISRFTERGVVVAGVEIEVDCVVLATGFDVSSSLQNKSGFEIAGTTETLDEHNRDGARTYHGFYSHGFPNCFFMGLGQNPRPANATGMLGQQAEHITEVLLRARELGATRIEPTKEAEDEWVTTARESWTKREGFYADCTPGFFGGEAKEAGEKPRGIVADAFGGTMREFWGMVETAKVDGFSGLTFD